MSAVGCASVINITGAGFAGAASLLPTCTLSSNVALSATVVSDSLVRCSTPAPTAAGTFALRLDFGDGTASHPDVVSSFTTYDAASVTLSSIYPAGGGYNLLTNAILFF